MSNYTDFQHRLFVDTALPYISNSSPIDVGPQYIDGSNVMTSIKGYLERRPGFPTYTTDSFGATFTIQRFFSWQTWAGVYFVMVNVTDSSGNTSIVWKQKIGTDTTFQSLFTSTTSNQKPFFFVCARNYVFFGNGVDMRKYDGTTVTTWGKTTPASAATLTNASSGSVPGVIGHTYVYTYGVNATGYISDTSTVSASTSAASRTWTIGGAYTTDTEVDKVHIYRTEDGGSIYRELPNSPIANNSGGGTWSYSDNATDLALLGTQAPLAGVNAPPTASNGCKLFANRIFTFINDTLYWSGLEEITNSTMNEENFPTNNKRRMGRQIIGIDLAGQYLLIFTTDGIYRLAGYSLATFTWSTLSKSHGLRNAAALASDGTNCVWLDVTNTIQVSNGDSIAYPDISAQIRLDIASIVHASASLTINTLNKRNWIVLADGGAGKIRVFDLDRKQWMPPWAVANTAVNMIETAAGTWAMAIGQGGKPLKMAEDGTTYQDAGASYTAYVILGLESLTGEGDRSNPASSGIVKFIGTERNSVAFSAVKYLLDEDPASGTYVNIFAAGANPVTPPPGRKATGTAIVEEWWWTSQQTASRRVSARLDWASANSNFKLYSIDIAYGNYASGV